MTIKELSIILVMIQFTFVLPNSSLAADNQCRSIFASQNETSLGELVSPRNKTNVLDTHLDLVHLAERIHSRQESFFRDLFNLSSGYKDIEEFRADYSRVNFTNSSTKELYKVISEKNLTIKIAAPSSIRTQILERGFLNQHSSETSGGWLDPIRRNEVESALALIESSEFSNIDPRVKPKYGTLEPGLNARFRLNTTTSFYGDDFFIFPINRIQSRTTFTLGDSLRNWKEGFKNDSWIGAPVPFSHVDVFLPFLHHNSRIGLFENSKDINRLGDEAKAIFHRLKLPRTSPFNSPYIEAQIWGPLEMSDVGAFVFTAKEPSGAFLRYLLDNNIPIFKQNVNSQNPELVPWSPN